MMSDWIFKANKLYNPSPRVHTNMFTAVSETRLFTMKMVENFPSTGHWTSGQAVNCQCHLLFSDEDSDDDGDDDDDDPERNFHPFHQITIFRLNANS